MKYRDGTEVHEGDVVAVHHSRSREHGVVKKVILPATDDAADWSLPRGGVLIEGGGLGLFTSESLEEDEDIDFVSRATSFAVQHGDERLRDDVLGRNLKRRP